ncbi:MAG: CU044_2847 family protein [Spirulina sp.]
MGSTESSGYPLMREALEDELGKIQMTVQKSPKNNSSIGILGYGLKAGKVTISEDLLKYLFSRIPKITQSIESQLAQTNATEAEVTFGIEITNDGMSVTKGLEEANFVFKLKWDNDRNS